MGIHYPTNFFLNPPVVLLSFTSRFTLVRWQIDSIMTALQEKIWTGTEGSSLLNLSLCLLLCLTCLVRLFLAPFIGAKIPRKGKKQRWVFKRGKQSKQGKQDKARQVM